MAPRIPYSTIPAGTANRWLLATAAFWPPQGECHGHGCAGPGSSLSATEGGRSPGLFLQNTGPVYQATSSWGSSSNPVQAQGACRALLPRPEASARPSLWALLVLISRLCGLVFWEEQSCFTYLVDACCLLSWSEWSHSEPTVHVHGMKCASGYAEIVKKQGSHCRRKKQIWNKGNKEERRCVEVEQQVSMTS